MSQNCPRRSKMPKKQISIAPKKDVRGDLVFLVTPNDKRANSVSIEAQLDRLDSWMYRMAPALVEKRMNKIATNYGFKDMVELSKFITQRLINEIHTYKRETIMGERGFTGGQWRLSEIVQARFGEKYNILKNIKGKEDGKNFYEDN